MTAISSIDSNLSELIANATNATNADLAVRSKVWNDKKLSAHHAIIPTDNMQVNVKKLRFFNNSMMFALVAEVPMPSSPLNIFLRLASVTNWCAFFIALKYGMIKN
jgi:hypothetical protein